MCIDSLYGSVQNVPDKYVEDIPSVYPYYRGDPILIDKNGDRIIHVNENSVNILDETDEEVVELPSCTDRWNLSFFPYVTLITETYGTISVDENDTIYRLYELLWSSIHI